MYTCKLENLVSTNLFNKEDFGTIELDQAELNLTVGESIVVNATTSKEDAKVVWSVADVGIVSVYNGLVKGLAEAPVNNVVKIGVSTSTNPRLSKNF